MAEPDRIIIPIICGPTGSGKTSAAVKLSSLFAVDIISADSRQIIRHLDIGTAKPGADEQKAVNFRLIDIIEPGERYSAYRFIEDANRAIDLTLTAGRTPVVVGGTGLYLRALSEGVVEIENEDPSIRKRLEDELDAIGPTKMHERLRSVDPFEADRIHPHNKARLIRALEIYHLTGKPKSELVAEGKYRKGDHTYNYFCLIPPREVLYRQIDDRVDEMISAGLVREVETLVGQGLKDKIRKSNVIGYNEILDYLDGNLSLVTVVDTIKMNSRRYAKRQLTWFRRQTEARYFESEEPLIEAVGELCSHWPERPI
ncbi:MAG: tRNA (adenosine(37)-N6)-dimethylallyltransferase MiaA [Candidatus Zixiibacteriota bacterium]|nr:MAG: tRNA (adenosine(37)-N6)-dimethylallyltransferase MiaA [candidate division Zixibacteria bacterium]